MDSTIIVAIVSGACTLLGVFLQNSYHNKSVSALIDYRLGIIEKKQDKYNNVLERMLTIETAIKYVEQKTDENTARIEKLEG